MAAVVIEATPQAARQAPVRRREERAVSAAPVSPLFDEAEIGERVEALAGEVVQAMGRDLVVVGVLKGSFVFLADLVRALSRAGATPRVEFMRLASYGQKQESSGEVLLLGDAPRDFQGRLVLLVDDIVDTGLSMAYGKRLLTERNAARVWTCALLDKPSRRQVEIAIDFTGFEIPDVFVVGYGIDYAEQYRYLPFIGKVT
jgi:hypoxanthine phosphoribosyltransferase